MSATDRRLDHLSAAAATLGYAVARPRSAAIASVVGLTALGWLWLGLMNAQGQSTLAALCRAQFGVGEWSGSQFVTVLAMWCAMVLAMMLPSTAPMILTYAEIANTAARKRQRVVSPFVLTVGYVAVWLGFAAVAASAHFGFARGAAGLEPATGSALSGAVFFGAGLYQFSALKQACLRLCRQPFQFFFVNWATTPHGVFRLGLRQGVYCLGCCWAMMTVMFVAGAMNVLWMAMLGGLMTIEKMTGARHFSTILGAGLVTVGAGFMLSGFGAF
ncbi:MAG: DUF2182 domain-containing protein [Pseudolabrys sp.]